MSKIYARRPLPRVTAVFLFAIEKSAKAQPPQHPIPLPAGGGKEVEEVEPWLTTQWRTEKLHVLLAEDGHICLIRRRLVVTWTTLVQELVLVPSDLFVNLPFCYWTHHGAVHNVRWDQNL